jgi:hypothetical protein
MPTTRIFWDTVVALEPAANERRAKTLLRLMTQPGELKDVFAKAGFVGISDTVLTIRMDFANFDDYWNPLITGQGNLEEYVASMPKHTREQVQSGVRAAYFCNRPDGPRSFAGVAWPVSGIVPAG